jgi:hypothetical protein
MSEFDSPWKEALDRFFKDFIEFFFPAIYADIDWDRGYEVLDKELEQIVREGEMGKRLADKLFKVWRKDGEEAWVLIHVEVQAKPDAGFPERMYVYNYRVFDRYRKPVVSLAVLGDEREQWKPTEYRSELWGCKVSMQFPVVKLQDYAADLEGLQATPNPFGLIVLAHLQSQRAVMARAVALGKCVSLRRCSIAEWKPRRFASCSVSSIGCWSCQRSLKNDSKTRSIATLRRKRCLM